MASARAVRSLAVLVAFALAALPAAFCFDMLQDSFVVKKPAVTADEAQARAPNDWTNPAWRAIRANVSAQLKDVDGSFKSFQGARRRSYRNAQHIARAKSAFQSNLEFIVQENAKGTNPYVLGVTNFSDMSYDEFANQYLTQMEQPAAPASSTSRSLKQALTEIGHCGVYWGSPGSNPRNVSAVSPVKNQGACGSCWAFGATAQIESLNAMNAKNMDAGNFLDLSEQVLVDCTYGRRDGCQGGWPTPAWDWMMSNGGLASESAVPYTSGSTGVFTNACSSIGGKPRAMGTVMTGYKQVTPTNDAGLVAALQTQPIFTAVAAGQEFQNYAGGAMTCTGTTVTHAVQTVGCGYLTAADGSYVPVYMIKNQWSQYWGYGGFAYILRTTQDGGSCLLGSGAYTVSLD